MRSSTRAVIWVACVALLICQVIFSFFGNENAVALEDTCNSNRLVVVRGSGERYNDSYLLNSFRSEIESKDLPNYYYFEIDNIGELANEPAYAAAPVTGSLQAFQTGVDAKINSGETGKYRRSVESGKNLLSKYIQNHTNDNSCFFLVGYSQGAQVIGEVLSNFDGNVEALTMIKYVGLLGDPKLDLDGIDLVAAKNVPWYRGDAKLRQHGFLSPRKPYLPNDGYQLKVKAASWCYYDDMICSNNYVKVASGAHGKYVERGAIKAMTREITDVVKSQQTGAYKEKFPATEGCGEQKQDLVIMLDTSPIMRRNANLFTDAPNPLDVRRAADGVTNLPLRTTGQMLLESGCGDKRVAVVGYGRPQDGAPQFLMGFTTNPNDIDALFKSLYVETASGTYERTQFREAAVLGMSSPWRPDASRSLLALTQFAGTGPSTRFGWSDPGTMRGYLSDSLGTQMIHLSRQHNVAIGGIVVPLTLWSGYNQASNETALGDTKAFLNSIAKETGAYNWTRYTDNFAPQTFRKIKLVDTIRESERLRDVSYATAKPVRTKVGQPVTLAVDDPTNLLASAKLRPGHSIEYMWRPSCTKLVDDPFVGSSTYTFTPTVAGTCKAAVIVSIRGAGAGCTSLCSEPFPPYFNQIITYDIEILPADHHDPLPPGSIQNLIKRIYPDRIEYSWDAPTDRGQYSDSQLIYTVRDSDGSMMTMSYDPKLTVTDLTDEDVLLDIAAAGQGGAGSPVSSNTATVIDMRPQPETDPTPNPDPVTDPDPEGGVPIDEETGEETTPPGEVLGENTDNQTEPKQNNQPTYSNPPRQQPPVVLTNSLAVSRSSSSAPTETIPVSTDLGLASPTGQVASATDTLAEAPKLTGLENRGLQPSIDWVVEDLLWLIVATGLIAFIILYLRKRRKHS